MNTMRTIYTIPQAAEVLGLTRQRVHQIVRKFDIGMRQGHLTILTDEDVKEIRNRPDGRAQRHLEAAAHGQ